MKMKIDREETIRAWRAMIRSGERMLNGGLFDGVYYARTAERAYYERRNERYRRALGALGASQATW